MSSQHHFHNGLPQLRTYLNTSKAAVFNFTYLDEYGKCYKVLRESFSTEIPHSAKLNYSF